MERRSTLAAELLGVRILCLTFRAFDRHLCPLVLPFPVSKKISRILRKSQIESAMMSSRVLAIFRNSSAFEILRNALSLENELL
jgi:hypothetical protein